MPGTKDSPLTGRYEGAHILSQTVKGYDEIELPSGPSDGNTWSKSEKLRGRVTRTLYVTPSDRSLLGIFSNYSDALISKGFSVAYECSDKDGRPNFVTLKYSQDRPRTLVIAPSMEGVRTYDVQRLIPRGLGPLSPMASNSTESGQVKNRRVEMVEQ
jgi:hypothetical protein